MTKIALISDLHFGVKKSNDTFLKSQLNFVEKEFIPYLKKNKIEYVYILGDVFDNRTHINVKTKNAVYDLFTNQLKKFKIKILLGNHDIYYNSTTRVHSLKWLKRFSNVTIVEDITVDKVYNKEILLVPWQCNENNFVKYVADNNINAKMLFGHFNICGFNLNKYKVSDTGLDSNIFYKNFRLIFTGHYHTRNKQKRGKSEIVYIGAPYHLTRNDIDEEKGFVVLDVDSMKYEYIDNKTSIKYVSVTYPQTVTKKMVKGNVVDINVVYNEKYNEDSFQTYIKKVESLGPILPPVVKVISTFLNNKINVDDYDMTNSYELMYEYIQKLNLDNKDEVYKILEKLYQEVKTDL